MAPGPVRYRRRVPRSMHSLFVSVTGMSVGGREAEETPYHRRKAAYSRGIDLIAHPFDGPNIDVIGFPSADRSRGFTAKRVPEVIP